MAQDHTPADLTDEQRANLKKLAAYLRSLPADYREFSMMEFAFDDSVYAHTATCGTVACAVGHGPKAGIAPLNNEDWFDYAKRVFCRDDSLTPVSAWQHMFSASWMCVDDTHTGAAARIEEVLSSGVPTNTRDQMHGKAPLSYAQVSA